MSDLNHKTIHDMFMKNAKKQGIKLVEGRMFSSDKEKAKYLRKLNIDAAKYFMHTPISGKKCKYELKAYEIMSDEHILMSDERENKIEQNEIAELIEFIKSNRKCY